MDRDLDLVKDLVALVGRSAIRELGFERDGLKVRIVRDAHAAVAVPLKGAERPDATAVSAQAVPSAGPRLHVVRAPLAGVFYRATAPSQPPLVEVGDVVTDGQKIGVLEAMKTFNTLEADRAGRIARILVEDGGPVQAGEPLFELDIV